MPSGTTTTCDVARYGRGAIYERYRCDRQEQSWQDVISANHDFALSVVAAVLTLNRRAIFAFPSHLQLGPSKCVSSAWKVCPRTNNVQDGSTSTLFKRAIKRRVWRLWPSREVIFAVPAGLSGKTEA